MSRRPVFAPAFHELALILCGMRRFDDAEAVLKQGSACCPEDGRANQAPERLVARWLKVPPSFVPVAQGGKSRAKQVLIEGDAGTLALLIEACVAELAG